MHSVTNLKITVIVIILFNAIVVHGQGIDSYEHNADQQINLDGVIRNDVQFNGYTNHWHDTYDAWYRYGNLFKISIPDLEKNILQSKVDIAEDMGVPGLMLQEGFMNHLYSQTYSTLSNPSITKLESTLSKENALIFVDPKSDVGIKVLEKIINKTVFPEIIKSHQYNAKSLIRADAFYLENGNRKLFVVSSSDNTTREKIKSLIASTKDIIDKYDLHKGWFGAETLLKSVTCTDGHPLEVIGKGMNEGNSWFVFNGYMDFLAKQELQDWVKQVNLPVVTDVGFGQIFGCKDYDGYFANEGNKEHIDKENVPFVLKTGNLSGNALSSMVLFLEKNQPLTNESMWTAILDRREVGVMEKGKMLGPANYRNALQLLLLDKQYLEEYFGDRINLEAKVNGYDLQVTITNKYDQAVAGNLNLTLPPTLTTTDKIPTTLNLPPNGSRTLHFSLSPSAESMDNSNPIAVQYNWNGKKKSTLAMLDLPQAISVHRLLYAHAPEVNFPVTIHNFSKKSSFPVKVQVMDLDNKNKVVFSTSQTCETPMSTFKDMSFNLKVAPGNYVVNISALGINYNSQLGVGKAEGKPYLYTQDLDSDGINEYRLENDSVQITLLATGARVIEYIVKSRNDNVLFKLWPKKAIDDKRPFRKRGYYPYGGFEDFLGQGSMETHQVYETEVVQKEGDFVRVRMWTDYFGNRLEKTFTLYGNSPLLEVRFALTFKNPEANVLGPQPILELGQRHWTEDVFTIPEMDGIKEYRMKPEKYFGRLFFLKEGWNAGYDTKEDITFVGAFPVDQPLFLHMWMNHPRNGDAHHYYTEFQPWTPIYQKSTMYFTYYLWGAGGPWENGVKDLREKNLITTK